MTYNDFGVFHHSMKNNNQYTNTTTPNNTKGNAHGSDVPLPLREWRELANWTQEELAEAANLSRSIIAKWECDMRQNANAKTLFSICNALSQKIGKEVKLIDIIEFAPLKAIR